MAEPRIVRFEISGIPRPKPEGFADPTPNPVVTFDDGERKELMSRVYVDEWVPGEGDLVGLTEAEARAFEFGRKPGVCPCCVLPDEERPAVLVLKLLGEVRVQPRLGLVVREGMREHTPFADRIDGLFG